ncbi:MAG: hypothetical protein EBZ07_02060 [Verrucomicrobia bacterium]|nr:hypothetical protein [Verrucomicrobiota bacterium]
MKFPSPTQTRSQPNPRQVKAEAPQKNWKQFFRKTIVLVLVISLAIHILFLLAFGSVAIFKGSIPKLPFVSQEIAADTVPEAPAPPMEESPATEEVATSDPFAKEAGGECGGFGHAHHRLGGELGSGDSQEYSGFRGRGGWRNRQGIRHGNGNHQGNGGTYFGETAFWGNSQGKKAGCGGQY